MKTISRKQALQRGIAAMELTLVLPLLLVLVFYLIDFGMLIHANIVVTNVCREGGSLVSRGINSGNEFLKMLEDNEISVDDGGGSGEEAVDEQALEADITKSALVNLFEGSLVEAVRRGASDVYHVVPAEGNRTNFLFRVDGDLQKWHTQESTTPEAVLAVVKDRTRMSTALNGR